MNKKIICITSMYPSSAYHWRGAFVKNFCQALNERGCEVYIITPISLIRWPLEVFNNYNSNIKIIDFEKNVIRPLFFSFGRLGWVIKFFRRLTFLSYRKSVEKALNSFEQKPDLVYCHFVVNGLAAQRWCSANRIGLQCISGESSYAQFLSGFATHEITSTVSLFKKMFFVSKKNRDAFNEFYNTNFNDENILPNCVNTRRFKPLIKNDCREKLGLPLDEKIIIFVGYFIARKSVLLVSEAIKKLNIKGVFIGSGPEKPVGDHVLYANPVQNEELHIWLNAADCFVLPSLHEGRSNALLEALACGVPCVVSKLPFNTEFLTAETVIFVDPKSVGSVIEAIRSIIYDNRRANCMKDASVALMKSFSLEARAEKFLSYID